MKASFKVTPVGIVHKREHNVRIEIHQKFSDALLGLESFSHIVVLYWFHENDNPDDRNILRVHPRKNPKNPLTGVFATRAPVRPNLVAVSTCRIESIQGNIIRIDDIDALDGTPVIDIKCYVPSKKAFADLKLPEWIN